MNTTRSLLLALALAHGTAVIAQTEPADTATDDALRPIAYLNGVTQDGLAAETAELARTIDALMAELQRNGFPEQSLAGLKQLVAQLGDLGGEDMAAIGERLRGLGEDPGIDARRAVTDAYIAQQAVEARLKALAKKIAVRQLREETVRRLETLIARQLSVQRETRAIGTAGVNGNRQQILIADQRGIGEDLDGFFLTGETLLANLRDSVGSNAPAAAEQPGFIDRVNGQLLKTYAAEAIDRLQAASYGEAYARQNALLAELNKILQGILSSQTKEERLASALQQIAALKQEQNARDQADKKPDAEEAQKAADEAKLLAAKVAAIDQEAAKAVAEAQKALQEQADEAAKNAAQNPPTKPEPTQPGQPESGEQLAANDPAAKPENAAAKPEPGQPESGEKLAANEPGQPEPGQPQPGEPEAGEKSDGEAAAAEKTPAPPSEAAAALAAAEAALRQQLAAEQAREADAQQQQQMAQNGQTPPTGQQQSQQQQQQSQNAQQQQQGQSQDGRESQGGEDGGYVENRAGDGASGPAQTVGALNRSEREAMASLQNERYPAEYASWVQQYWRNLAQGQ